ncbi:9263_t:CDS:2, partial [Acaulospora colombiana]
RRSKMNPFQSMVVALCSDVSLTVDALSVSSSVATVRKAVLDAITKTLKDTPNSSETTEQRYGRFIALGDLCQKLLTTNPHATTQKPQEESLFHIAKLMLEKGFVSSLSAVLAEVDLAHPMASLVTTKVSIKIGRVTEKADGPSTVPDRPADFSTDSEAESMVTDTEEALDPYSTSALGMYGGEAEAAFAEVEEPLDDEEEDDIEMDYAEDDFVSEDSEDEDDPEEMDATTG